MNTGYESEDSSDIEDAKIKQKLKISNKSKKISKENDNSEFEN